MSEPLRLLVVEDSEAAVAPLVRELRRHGYEPEAVQVGAADAMRDALQRQAWDVVIADHALPGFSSQDALRILQESGLDLPFIIVSETTGEEAAVTAMKAGAHDYVMKDHLTRLGPAVERELQEASVRRQRRETERCLAAQQAVTGILAEADTLGEAGAKILQAIAKNGEWAAGEIWIVDRPSDALRCLEIWHAASKPLGEFATRTRAMTFARGVGLPGRVWASAQPAWIADVTQDENFPRAPLAVEAGLRGAIGLPIVVGHEVMGVIAFFRTAPERPDEKLLSVLNAIGSQIGQFLVRQQAEGELKKLSSAVKQTANSVLITDRNGVIEYVNPAFEQTTGYAREEVIGKTPRVLKSGHHDQTHYETQWNTILAGETFFAEFVNRKKSGELYHTEQSITPIRDTHGHVTHFVSTGRDITQRKLAELRIQHLNRVYTIWSEINHVIVRVREPQEMLEAACRIAVEKGGFRMAWIGRLDARTGIIAPAAAAGVIEGYLETMKVNLHDEARSHGPTGEAVRQGQHSICNDIERDPRMAPWREEALRRGYRSSAAFPLKIRSETIGCLNFYAHEPGFFDDGEMRLLDELAMDIGFALEVDAQEAERQQAEVTLREQREQYHKLVELSVDAIFVVQDGKFLLVNSAAVKLFGAGRPEQLLGKLVLDFIHKDYHEIIRERAWRAQQQDEPLPLLEEKYLRLDGSSVDVEAISTRFQFRGQTALLVEARDITERQRAAESLRASEARYRTLAESAQDIIYVINREFRVEYINEYGARQFGRSPLEITGQHLTELFPPETTQWQLPDMADIFRTGESLHRERQLPAGQRLIWLDSRLVPIKNATGEVESILGISRDITERKQVQGQMLRAQRLESIGTLAGGVAHDLNNALAPIMMATELLRLKFPDTASRYLELIQDAAQRGADMVKQLLTFAKGVEGERLLVQPRHLLKEIQKLIRSTFPKNIQLQTSSAKDLRTILGDATQLHQVLLNLCVNARDAMPEGGTLTLEAENMELDAVQANTVLEAQPGHYVVWRVTDTGTGILPEVLERIFEPFFSTKGPDKGTGLGLSTVIGIVKGHGGFVQVYSTPGQGSTFAVYLPAYGAGTGDTTLLTKTDTLFRGHGETILVVDDEVAVRNVLRAVLSKLNFKVLTASDGTTALIQVAENRTELRAVITDLHMPHMDGLSLARVLKGRLPQTGIIVVSGRLDEREANEFKQLGVNALLDKPFTQEKLVEALKTVFQK